MPLIRFKTMNIFDVKFPESLGDWRGFINMLIYFTMKITA